VNKNADRPVHMHLSGLAKGNVLDLHLQKQGYERWPITCSEESYLESIEKDKLVYLTADSPNLLTELDDSKAYIIGGIVDRNRYKRLTLDKAEKDGIAHGKLPIQEHV
jgi:tRNA (guanine9-N1)-methyltransferase